MKLQSRVKETKTLQISTDDNRYLRGVWDYREIDDLNTDQMFAGNLTYDIKSADGEKIIPHLFKGLDETFSSRVTNDDIIVAGSNFGCGSSREHPAVGLASAGVKAVLVKSVARIFYRSAINQGLPIIVLPEFVDNFNKDSPISIDLEGGQITNGDKIYNIGKLPAELLEIFNAGGLIKYYKKQYSK